MYIHIHIYAYLHINQYIKACTCVSYLCGFKHLQISTELAVNMFATLLTEFIGDPWNLFDLIVVAVSLVSLVCAPPPSSLSYLTSIGHTISHPKPSVSCVT